MCSEDYLRITGAMSLSRQNSYDRYCGAVGFISGKGSNDPTTFAINSSLLCKYLNLMASLVYMRSLSALFSSNFWLQVCSKFLRIGAVNRQAFLSSHSLRQKCEPRERLHELKKCLFSALKLSGLLHTDRKLELKTGPLLAHVDDPIVCKEVGNCCMITCLQGNLALCRFAITYRVDSFSKCPAFLQLK